MKKVTTIRRNLQAIRVTGCRVGSLSKGLLAAWGKASYRVRPPVGLSCGPPIGLLAARRLRASYGHYQEALNRRAAKKLARQSTSTNINTSPHQHIRINTSPRNRRS